MKTIVLFKCPDSAAERHKLAGFNSVARERGWNVQTVEPVRTAAEARKVIDFWRPDGVIVSCIAGVNDLPSTAFGPRPTVFLGRPLTHLARTDSFVCLNTRTATELAAHELFRLDLRHYGYVPWDEPAAWNDESEAAFSDIMSFNGRDHSIFPAHGHRTRRLRLQALARWLRRLPRPVGVFASCDPVGVDVLEACRLARLAVPQEVVVISKNNEEEVCENTIPALSSIDINLPQAGRLAAEALAALMANPRHRPIQRVYEPVQLIRRASSFRFGGNCKPVEHALELIRQNACRGLTASEVLKLFPGSRRMAEIRFRSVTGQSVLSAIRAVRLAKANQLLQQTNLKLDAIANFCGYRSAAAFSVFYKAETGRTPRKGSRPADGSMTTRPRPFP